MFVFILPFSRDALKALLPGARSAIAISTSPGEVKPVPVAVCPVKSSLQPANGSADGSDDGSADGLSEGSGEGSWLKSGK